LVLLKLFRKQVDYNRYPSGTYINYQYQGEVQVKHGDNENKRGTDPSGNHEHDGAKIKVRFVVILDQEEQRLNNRQHPRHEQELAFVLHRFEENCEIGVTLLIVVEELLLPLELLVDIVCELQQAFYLLLLAHPVGFGFELLYSLL